jgi:hypothetical protein
MAGLTAGAITLPGSLGFTRLVLDGSGAVLLRTAISHPCVG